MLFYILIIIGVTALDQIVKAIVVHSLMALTTVPIIPNVFHLTYIENTGAAFSILSGRSTLLIITTLALLAMLFFWLYELPKTRQYMRLNTAIAFVIGGALGNLIDRIHYGYVVDFFDFRLIGFAIFNVADVFVCVGCALIIIDVIKNDFNKKPDQSTQSTKTEK